LDFVGAVSGGGGLARRGAGQGVSGM